MARFVRKLAFSIFRHEKMEKVNKTNKCTPRL